MFSYKDKKTAKAVSEAMEQIKVNEANQSHTKWTYADSRVGDHFNIDGKWVTASKEDMSPGGIVHDKVIKNDPSYGDKDYAADRDRDRKIYSISTPDGGDRMQVMRHHDGSFETVHSGLERNDPSGGIKTGSDTTRWMGPDSVNKALRSTLNTIGPKGDNYPSQLGEQNLDGISGLVNFSRYEKPKPYNTLSTYTGQPGPHEPWGGEYATTYTSDDFNYVQGGGFKGADLQTPQGRIYYDKSSVTMPSGQKIKGSGRGSGTAERNRRALGEQDRPSDDQIQFNKAFGSNEDLENAINTITGTIPPIPQERADYRSLEKHLQGQDSGVVNPRHQHRDLNLGMVKEEQSSGDFLAKYVTSGKAGKDVFVPGEDISKMGPLEKIRYIRKASKYMNSNPVQNKPVPGREVPGSFASPVDDPTGQFGRPGMPGGQTAQSANDMTFGDVYMADPRDPKNNYRPTVGREYIQGRKQDLVDVYGPDVDKGFRKAEREYEQQYQKELDDRRNSTLSQNNILPPDTRSSAKKLRDRFNRYLGIGGNSYDSEKNKDPATTQYSVF